MSVWQRVSQRWWVAGVVLVVVVALAVWASTLAFQGGAGDHSSGKSQCRVSELPQPDTGNLSGGMDVSGSGEYVVGSPENGVIRWEDGEPEVLEDVARANAVNSSGTVVGSSQEDSGSAWRYDDEVTELRSPRGDETLVSDINDAGDIVGVERDADAEHEVADGDPVSTRGQPLLWEAGSVEPVEMEVEDGMRANATVITSDGQVLGYQVSNGTDDQVPWRWDRDGNGEELPEMSDGEPATPVDVTGEWVLSTTASDGYRWKLPEPDETQKVRLEKQSVTAIDAKGVAYGDAEYDVPGREIAGEVDALDNLSDPTENGMGWNEVAASSEDGSVLIGLSTDDDGDTKPVTWTCT